MRFLDVLVASVPIVLPAMALIALAIRIDNQGPVLHSQKRVGLERPRPRRRSLNSDECRCRHGFRRPFKLYTFRSMVSCAVPGTGPSGPGSGSPGSSGSGASCGVPTPAICGSS